MNQTESSLEYQRKLLETRLGTIKELEQTVLLQRLEIAVFIALLSGAAAAFALVMAIVTPSWLYNALVVSSFFNLGWSISRWIRARDDFREAGVDTNPGVHTGA